MDSIDLRSDTVTWPTEAMREAMAAARVGDDVWGDDPTMIELEALAAEMTGKQAAAFVPSGTMGNLASVLTHCGRGDEVILAKKAHIFKYEAGGIAALGGVHSYPVDLQVDGTLDLDDIRHAIREDDPHFPHTRLVALENTQGTIGGMPITPEYTRSVRALCDDYGLKLHIDGARIWNAAAALDVDIKDLTTPADSVTFCLSKGLCAPVGSIVVGDADFIASLRRTRKMLGGGMRQSGVLAAAAIIALTEMTTRLHEDHANARALAEGLNSLPGISVRLEQVQTNMVFFWIDDTLPIDAAGFAALMEQQHGIKLDVIAPRGIRAVTHYWITPERVETVLATFTDELNRMGV